MTKYLSFRIDAADRKRFHTGSYLFFLSLLALSLPVSFFLLSLAMIGLAMNWILEGEFRMKWSKLKENKALMFFMLIYPVHLIWMINTSDFEYGVHDLRIKLPLLVLPLVTGTSNYLSEKKLRIVFLAFITGCFLAGILAVFRYTGIIHVNNPDVRNISGSLSHIRLALMVNLAFFLALDMVKKTDDRRFRLLLIILAIWFLLFLFFLKSLTGLVVLLLVSIMIGYQEGRKSGSVWKGRLYNFSLFLLPALVISYVIFVTDRFYPNTSGEFSALESHTSGGLPYSHDTTAGALENGHYVWIYFCEPELRQAWNLRSGFKYDSLDRQGQEIRFTLIRYLTSKGLRKDRAGVEALTNEDVCQIEGGMANYIYADRISLYPYIYRVIWEIDAYRRGENPSGHSITQRFEYSRAAWYIIRHHPLFGTGTGDVAVSFKAAYDEMQSQLTQRWRLRAHNQYITFLLTFGLTGFILVMAGLLGPVVILWKRLDRIDLIFLVIAGLSMFNEDTLETHAGVSYVAFFIALLLFGREKHLKDDNYAA
ncbi:MAG: O-antigen ligase family protein [Bacteroidales bacterium]